MTTVFKQGGLYVVSDLLRHGTAVYTVSFKGVTSSIGL